MKSDAAILALQNLKAEAETNPMDLFPEGPRLAWRSKVMSVLTKAKSEQVSAFSAIQYFAFYDETYDAEVRSFRRGLSEAIGLIDGAIFELGLSVGEDARSLKAESYDPDLWEYVKGLIEIGDWDKVASAAVTFVEDHFRVWTGSPRSSTGGNLVGKALFSQVLGKESAFRLGNEASEWDGWLYLGMGLAQALGNHARHNVMKREDLERYALGALGLASLLLTQMRFQHGNKLNFGGGK
jgi:hypothetical protein